MALVDYSDSDASDAEEQKVAKANLSTSKSGFQKVIDRTNPGKIRVSLPQSTVPKETTHEQAPPAKRAKLGSGAFSGLNSLLPAPKHAPPANTILGGGSIKKGLGGGVNLRTGAVPGFSRETESEREHNEDLGSLDASNGQSELGRHQTKTAEVQAQIPADEVKLVGKPLMFKPLSVSNKQKKQRKRPATQDTNTNPNASKSVADIVPETPAPRVKVSLFSLTAETDNIQTTTSNREYVPMIIGDIEGVEEDDFDLGQSSLTPSYEDFTPNASFSEQLPPAPTPPVSQSLDDIAGDLNLSAAERRQLFGRRKEGRGQAATNIINFNTDQEYLHNEALRATGEQVSHNPVRAIAPGKHSLKQLVNAAQSQKEALEESFAKGKNNRAEASSRYGW